MNSLTIVFYPNSPLSDVEIKKLKDKFIECFDEGNCFELEFGNFGGNMKTKVNVDENDVERLLNHITSMFDLKILGSLISPTGLLTMYNISGYPRVLISLKISHPKKVPAEIPDILRRTVNITRTCNIAATSILFSGIIIGVLETFDPTDYLEIIFNALTDFKVNICGSIWVEGENTVANFDYTPAM
jgi:hypothetical protein